MSELTPSNEDYLKVIWGAQEWTGEPVTTKALAAKVGHSPSTVSESIKKLTKQGLVSHARYGTSELTEAGRAAAVAMVRRHRLIETFLVEHLGYTWDEVHDEAEVLEHAVSEAFIDRLDALLGHPVRDPHGDPIPSAAGVVTRPPAVLLAAVDVGASGVVARVSDDDPDVLRTLAALGMGLDTPLEVVARGAGADGSVTVRLAAGGAGLVELSLAAAEAIWVVVGGG